MSDEQAVVALRDQATGIQGWSLALTVSNQADANTALERVAEIKGIRKRWVDYWSPVKLAAHSAWKGIVEKEKQGTDVLDDAERTAKRKVQVWQQAEREKAEAERRRLQAIEDERARKERARLEAQAAKLKTPEKQAERLEQAAAVEPVLVSVAPPAIEGAQTRTTWKAELTNLADLIAASTPGSTAASLLEFNDKAANALARATKGSVQVPGVRFYPDETLAVPAK